MRVLLVSTHVDQTTG
jgi:hypothetical protein